MSEFGVVSETVNDASVEIRELADTMQTVRTIGDGVCIALGAASVALPIILPVTAPIISTCETQVFPLLQEVIEACYAVSDLLQKTWVVMDTADNIAAGDFDGLAADGIHHANESMEEYQKASEE